MSYEREQLLVKHLKDQLYEANQVKWKYKKVKQQLKVRVQEMEAKIKMLTEEVTEMIVQP